MHMSKMSPERSLWKQASRAINGLVVLGILFAGSHALAPKAYADGNIEPQNAPTASADDTACEFIVGLNQNTLHLATSAWSRVKTRAESHDPKNVYSPVIRGTPGDFERDGGALLCAQGWPDQGGARFRQESDGDISNVIIVGNEMSTRLFPKDANAQGKLEESLRRIALEYYPNRTITISQRLSSIGTIETIAEAGPLDVTKARAQAKDTLNEFLAKIPVAAGYGLGNTVLDEIINHIFERATGCSRSYAEHHGKLELLDFMVNLLAAGDPAGFNNAGVEVFEGKFTLPGNIPTGEKTYFFLQDTDKYKIAFAVNPPVAPASKEKIKAGTLYFQEKGPKADASFQSLRKSLTPVTDPKKISEISSKATQRLRFEVKRLNPDELQRWAADTLPPCPTPNPDNFSFNFVPVPASQPESAPENEADSAKAWATFAIGITLGALTLAGAKIVYEDKK